MTQLKITSPYIIGKNKLEILFTSGINEFIFHDLLKLDSIYEIYPYHYTCSYSSIFLNNQYNVPLRDCLHGQTIAKKIEYLAIFSIALQTFFKDYLEIEIFLLASEDLCNKFYISTLFSTDFSNVQGFDNFVIEFASDKFIIHNKILDIISSFKEC